MIRIAICDEDQMNCSMIEKNILGYCKRNNTKMEIEVFYSGVELVNFILKEYCFDLIFMETNLKDISGITIGKILRDLLDIQTAQIVYMSKSDQNVMELFNIRPMRFITKPINAYIIIDSIRLAMKLLDKFCDMFMYKKGYVIYKIPYKNILYFESNDREIRIVTTTSIDHFYGKLESVYNQAANYHFIQIHKSYIVNFSHVSRFNCYEVVMSNGDSLPVSQSRRKMMRELQMQMKEEIF